MSKFRDFLYLDDRFVESLLSGVEGGQYESVDEKLVKSRGGSGKLEGGLSGVASGGLSEGASESSERQRVLSQNAEARFSRLWDAIADDEDEQILECDPSSPNPWKAADDSKFCRFVGRLSVPALVSALAVSSEVLQLGRLMEQVGVLTPAINDMQNIERMAAMKDVIKDSFPVVLRMHDDHPAVALPLDTEWSRVKIDRYTGKATVFGRIVERIPEKQPISSCVSRVHSLPSSRGSSGVPLSGKGRPLSTRRRSWLALFWLCESSQSTSNTQKLQQFG